MLAGTGGQDSFVSASPAICLPLFSDTTPTPFLHPAYPFPPPCLPFSSTPPTLFLHPACPFHPPCLPLSSTLPTPFVHPTCPFRPLPPRAMYAPLRPRALSAPLPPRALCASLPPDPLAPPPHPQVFSNWTDPGASALDSKGSSVQLSNTVLQPSSLAANNTCTLPAICLFLQKTVSSSNPIQVRCTACTHATVPYCMHLCCSYVLHAFVLQLCAACICAAAMCCMHLCYSSVLCAFVLKLCTTCIRYTAPYCWLPPRVHMHSLYSSVLLATAPCSYAFVIQLCTAGYRPVFICIRYTAPYCCTAVLLPPRVHMHFLANCSGL